MGNQEVIRHGEEFILEHVYDPQKAREYYLRTRELKGRQPGRKLEPVGRIGLQTVTGQKLKPAVMSQTAEQRKAATEVRVKALKARLEKLKSVLAELVKQAKKRSGSDVVEKDSKKPASAKDNKPQTAAEKKAAQKRYEEQKKNSTANEEQNLQAEIKAVEAKIARAREQLRKAIVRARARAAVKKPAPQRRATTLERNSQNGS